MQDAHVDLPRCEARNATENHAPDKGKDVGVGDGRGRDRSAGRGGEQAGDGDGEQGSCEGRGNAGTAGDGGVDGSVVLVSAGARIVFGGGAEKLAWKNEGGKGHGKRLGVLRLRRTFCVKF